MWECVAMCMVLLASPITALGSLHAQESCCLARR